MNNPAEIAYIGIGANLGDATATVKAAIAALKSLPDTLWQTASSLYRTAPIDADGEDYINAVACVKTQLSAIDFLHALQAIEQDFGRQRPYYHAPRTLDLDILLFGEQQLNSDELKVPHPQMTRRAFVLIPLTEIAPDLIIPGKGKAQTWLPSIADQRIERLR